MIVAVDVGYFGTAAGETGRCGVVAFRNWDAAHPEHELIVEVTNVRAYVPGRLFERELPCLLAGLDKLRSDHGSIELDVVIVDANVRLNSAGAPGLGMHLHRAIDDAVAVVGVAKSAFGDLDATEVRRGASKKPLYVTAVGLDEQTAAESIAGMAGDHRIPTMLARADQLSRGAEPR